MIGRYIPFSRVSRIAAIGAATVLVGTVVFLLAKYPALPDVLPVHFKRGGLPDGWQYKTLGRVLLPAFIQASLGLTFGTIAVLLMSRPSGGHQPDAPDVRAASAAAETVLLIAAIWITFQAYTAFALVRVWLTGYGNLGRLFSAFELVGLLLTGAVAVRGHARVGRPAPRAYVAEHWRLGQLYKNADDPALFVPTRDGCKWTLNFGRPVAAALLGVVLAVGVLGPTLILVLALRYNF
jgi:uncharacterized membrane protein